MPLNPYRPSREKKTGRYAVSKRPTKLKMTSSLRVIIEYLVRKDGMVIIFFVSACIDHYKELSVFCLLCRKNLFVLSNDQSEPDNNVGRL